MKNLKYLLLTLLLSSYAGMSFGQINNYSYFDMEVVLSTSLTELQLNQQTASLRSNAEFNNNEFEKHEVSFDDEDVNANRFVIRGSSNYKNAIALLNANSLIQNVKTTFVLKVATNNAQISVSALNAAASGIFTNPMFQGQQFVKAAENVAALDGYFRITVEGAGIEDPINDAITVLENTDLFSSVNYYGISRMLSNCSTSHLPNDYHLNQQAALDVINVRCAWGLTTGNSNIVLGLVDGGIRETHEDLVNKIVHNNGYHITDAHGTMVSSIMAAETNNNLGISSVGYSSSIAFESGSNSNGYIDGAIHNLVAAGAKVINVSLTGTNLSKTEAQQIIDQGVTLVLSAGNKPWSVYHSNIADIPGVIVVSGMSPVDLKAATSNHARNQFVDFCAPSVAMYGAYSGSDSDYNTDWGTSYASPVVSGIIGLMLDANPCLKPAMIENILKNTTSPLADASSYPGLVGTGYVDAYEAVRVAQEMNSPTLDLFTKDRPEDFGKEPNAYHWQADYDESPDIWVRNQADGFTNQVHQNPIYFASSPTTLHVYVRVHNKSCQNSNGTEELSLYWSKSSGWASWPDNWDGSSPTVGDKIGTVTLPVIGGGESEIVELVWNPISPMIFDNWNTCLLTQLTNVNGDGITFYPGRQDQDVRKNNNVSMRNVTILQGPVSPKGGVVQGFEVPMGTFMYIGNPTTNEHDLDIRFTEEEINNGLSLFSQAEVKLYFEQNDWDFISSFFEGNEDFTILAPQEVLINNGNAELTDIAFGKEHRIPMYVGVHFLTEEPTTDNEFKLHVREYLSTDQSLVGGEHFTIFKNDRIAFDAEAGFNVEIHKNESTTLNASTINENAVYNWYNSNGHLIYTGTDLTISPEVSETYKLEVIADADGFKDYDEVEVTVKEFYINAISPNPASTTMTVDYKTSETDNGYIRVMNSLGTVSNNHIIIANSSNQTIDVSSFQTGNYSVSLIINGVIADTKQVIIQ